MPAGEMTLTLDNVYCLLQLPMTGRAIDNVPSLFNRDRTKALLMTHLGILIETEVASATNAGVRVKLTWLVDVTPSTPHIYVLIIK